MLNYCPALTSLSSYYCLQDIQQDLFSKYFCPSSSDEDESANKSVSSNHMAGKIYL